MTEEGHSETGKLPRLLWPVGEAEGVREGLDKSDAVTEGPVNLALKGSSPCGCNGAQLKASW